MSRHQGDRAGDRELTEADARELLDRLKDLRTEWARFAVLSRADFDAFRERGASLPADFHTRCAELEEQKGDLVSQLRFATESLTTDEWHLPDASASLHKFEASLTELVRLCREGDRRRQQTRLGQVETLRYLVRLTCDEPQVAEDVTTLKRTLAALLNRLQSDPAAVPDTESQRLLQAAQSLATLIRDVAGLQETSGTDDSSPALSHDDFQNSFEDVVDGFGTAIALATLRGRVRFALADQPRPGAAAGATTAGDRPSAEQLRKLTDRFGTRSAFSAPSVERSEASPPRESAPVMVTTETLLNAVSSLRSRLPEPSLYSDEMMDLTAAVLTNLANAADYTAEILEHRGADRQMYRIELQTALELLAEAQNAVRTEQETQRPQDGAVPEQDAVFYWLREISDRNAEAIPIRQYMRREDRADPDHHGDLAARIRSARQDWKTARRADALPQQIAGLVSQLDDSESDIVWRQIDVLVREFLRCGRRASDVDLRDALLPAADVFPEIGGTVSEDVTAWRPSPQLADVIGQVHRFLDHQAVEALQQTGSGHRSCPQTEQVRTLLSDCTLALVGGTPKPDAARRVENAFGLKELVWVPASPQDRVSDLRPLIRDASVVVLITGLIGHKHNELRTMCSDCGIPWVQLKHNAGYGVNQLAAAILHQASDRLRRADVPSQGESPPLG